QRHVDVHGSSVVIPISILENTEVDLFRSMTLQLLAGSNLFLGVDGIRTVTFDDNDATWKGTLQSDNEELGFTLTVIDDGSGPDGTLVSDGLGMIPAGSYPATLVMNNLQFSAAIAGMSVSSTNSGVQTDIDLALQLDAMDGQSNQVVGADELMGTFQLVSTLSGAPHLNATNEGIFVMVKCPPLAATNNVRFSDAP
ncbi:MAG: hypothetical protein AAF492_27125, partial [Verrucomicrobiota bacterium]